MSNYTINLEEFQELLDSLCKQYGLDPVELRFDHSLLTNKNARGEYQFYEHRIVLDERVDSCLFKEVLFHEFRHYYQCVNYKDIMIWWLNSGSFYQEFYFTKLCSIEEDARVFSKTFGESNRQDLLDFYDVEDLEEIKNSPMSWELVIDFLDNL